MSVTVPAWSMCIYWTSSVSTGALQHQHVPCVFTGLVVPILVHCQTSIQWIINVMSISGLKVPYFTTRCLKNVVTKNQHCDIGCVQNERQLGVSPRFMTTRLAYLPTVTFRCSAEYPTKWRTLGYGIWDNLFRFLVSLLVVECTRAHCLSSNEWSRELYSIQNIVLSTLFCCLGNRTPGSSE